jgi:hypothetical protein
MSLGQSMQLLATDKDGSAAIAKMIARQHARFMRVEGRFDIDPQYPDFLR